MEAGQSYREISHRRGISNNTVLDIVNRRPADNVRAAWTLIAMAVALGLLAAFLWGSADFLIRWGGRSLGVFRSMLYAQGFSFLCIGLWVVSSPNTRQPIHEASALAWIAALVAGIAGFAATLALYRGFQIGRVSVVSPVAGAYGAVTAFLAILTGESLEIAVIAGIAMIVGGVMLVAIPAHVDGAPEPRAGPKNSGFLWAAISCVCFGLCYWIQGRFAVPELGPVLPVGVFYVVSTTFLAVAAIVRRPPLVVSLRDAVLVVSTGTVAVLGFIALSAGLATGNVAVVTVISSLQCPITIGLAVIFLGERLVIRQWVGVAAVVIGLGLIRA